MKKDIETRADIELLVNVFYEKIKADKQLGYIFKEIVKVNGETHLQTMCDFLENIILFTGRYDGNPMNLHQHLHNITPLNVAHFNQWNQLFVCSVDELFVGEKASLAKKRAINISEIIKKKILNYQQGNE